MAENEYERLKDWKADRGFFLTLPVAKFKDEN